MVGVIGQRRDAAILSKGNTAACGNQNLSALEAADESSHV